jgi:hypothetical protein
MSRNQSDLLSIVHEGLGLCEPLIPVDWLYVTLGSILIIFTVVGNLLVVLSVLVVKNLRKPHNYLMVSLAAADLLVAVIVMPFAIVLHINCEVWPMGTFWCELWIAGRTIVINAMICL